jgi:hypothetical protein
MSRLIYLSKSDFKIAKSCPTKLYYRKLGYPTNQDSDFSISSTALIINKMAQLLYPDGIQIRANYRSDRTLEQDLERTTKLLKQEHIVLFNPVIYAKNKLVVIDILVKQGNKFDLIEVKPKAFDGFKHQFHSIFRNKRSGKISSIWKSCLEDITYQTYVLTELLDQTFDDFELMPYLCMPDKSKSTDIDGLGAYFTIVKDQVDFIGDLAQFKNNHILSLLSVDNEVTELAQFVSESTNIYLDSLIGNQGIHKIYTPINKNCKTCEFRINQSEHNPDQKNGFKECWGELAEIDPHILDVYQVATLGERHHPLVNILIRAEKVSMYDLPIAVLNESMHKQRQMIQIEYTKLNQEWLSEQLADVVDSFEYPLYFIDFETARLDIPFHKGIDLYEQIAFEWSCHKVNHHHNLDDYLQSAPEHADWIDLSADFPNFKFAEALMAQIGDRGTVLIWGTHEKSVLKDIYDQIEYYGYQNPQLKLWLEQLIGDRSRLVDLNAMTLKHYFHPRMKGKTSLKLVLPAIWGTNNYLHQISWLSKYFKQNHNGNILSPYDVLPKVEILNRSEIIKEGNGAAIAYQELLHDTSKQDPKIKAKWQELLQQYCCLDTMAMVIVWTHWRYLINLA